METLYGTIRRKDPMTIQHLSIHLGNMFSLKTQFQMCSWNTSGPGSSEVRRCFKSNQRKLGYDVEILAGRLAFLGEEQPTTRSETVEFSTVHDARIPSDITGQVNLLLSGIVTTLSTAHELYQHAHVSKDVGTAHIVGEQIVHLESMIITLRRFLAVRSEAKRQGSSRESSSKKVASFPGAGGSQHRLDA